MTLHLPHARTHAMPRALRLLALCCALHCTGVAAEAEVAQAEAPPATGTREALDARRDAAQQTFLRLSDEQRYAEAREIAAQIVEMSARLHGEGSIETAAPLTNLATTLLALGDIEGAEQAYLASIRAIEGNAGPASTRLVNPLVGLGETLVRASRYEQARDVYERALRVSHINDGFYNEGQFKIMDGLSEAWLGLGKLDKANTQQRTQVAIQRRRTGADSEDMVPALYKLGGWYNRTGQYVEARETYLAARRIIRQSRGDTDPASVDALIGEALTYANEGAAPASASALKRALAVIDGQPETDHRKRAEVLIALGDLYILNNQPRAANQRYAQAWQELTGDPALETERDQYFGQAGRIAGPRLPQVVGADGGALAPTAVSQTLPRGVVLAEFTVRTDGEASDIRIVESDPPGLLDQQVLRSLASTAFRPKLADGTAVDSDGVQFRHEFRYAPPAPGASGEAPAPATSPAGERGERIGFPGGDDPVDGGETR